MTHDDDDDDDDDECDDDDILPQFHMRVNLGLKILF